MWLTCQSVSWSSSSIQPSASHQNSWPQQNWHPLESLVFSASLSSFPSLVDNGAWIHHHSVCLREFQQPTRERKGLERWCSVATVTTSAVRFHQGSDYRPTARVIEFNATHNGPSIDLYVWSSSSTCIHSVLQSKQHSKEHKITSSSGPPSFSMFHTEKHENIEKLGGPTETGQD